MALTLDPWTTTADEPARLKDLEIIFKNILTLVVPLAGTAIFVMILIGGFQFLTAGDNPEQVKKAKGTLTAAILGLFLLVAVWFIFLIIQKFTGVTVTEVELPD